MKIKLKTGISVLGKAGDVVDVSQTLASGLIRRRQAEPTKERIDATDKDGKRHIEVDRSTNYNAVEAAEMVRNMDSKQAQSFTKGESRKTVLKELKDEIYTKEEKEKYKTK